MSLPPTSNLTQHDTVRLISTGRLKDPVLLPLAANHGALEDLAELESATNGRLIAQESGLPHLDPRELVFGRAGFTFINAAFTPTPAQLDWAKAVVATFAANPGAGALQLEGRMIDAPHLKAAQRLLSA